MGGEASGGPASASLVAAVNMFHRRETSLFDTPDLDPWLSLTCLRLEPKVFCRG